MLNIDKGIIGKDLKIKHRSIILASKAVKALAEKTRLKFSEEAETAIHCCIEMYHFKITKKLINIFHLNSAILCWPKDSIVHSKQ